MSQLGFGREGPPRKLRLSNCLTARRCDVGSKHSPLSEAHSGESKNFWLRARQQAGAVHPWKELPTQFH